MSMLPWEDTQIPWETGLFDRVVSVSRAKTIAIPVSGGSGVGLTGYSGLEQTTSSATIGEQQLYTNLPASIQAKSPGRTKGTLLPADIVYKPEWVIFIPASNISLYDIRDHDIIYDDEGYRYEVSQNMWTEFGYQLSTVRLET